MKQSPRILIGVLVLLALSGLILGSDWLRRQANIPPPATGTPLPAGAIPIYLDGELVAGFTPADLGSLEQVSFVEPVEGKTQQGWRLKDILLLFVDPEIMQPETVIVVSSASRGKSAELTWAEVQDDSNLVMFDLSNRGTLKLVSQGLSKLDEREEWVQDSDKIEIFTQQP
jgi:hypothetical protein